MADGWITDAQDYWIAHFHWDDKSWSKDKRLFVDYGREIPGQPALLKSRRHLRAEEARTLWKSLCSSGWKQRTPAWGVDAEP